MELEGTPILRSAPPGSAPFSRRPWRLLDHSRSGGNDCFTFAFSIFESRLVALTPFSFASAKISAISSPLTSRICRYSSMISLNRVVSEAVCLGGEDSRQPVDRGAALVEHDPPPSPGASARLLPLCWPGHQRPLPIGEIGEFADGLRQRRCLRSTGFAARHRAHESSRMSAW